MNNNILLYSLGLLLAVLVCNFQTLQAQGVSISETNSPPDPSAMLDVQSLTKGMLIPRMSYAQRIGIAAPANGLIVYQISNSSGTRRGFWYYDGPQAQWIFLGRGEYAATVQQPNTLVSSSMPSSVTAIPAVGQIQINWGIIPEIISPPTVLVTPEYSVVSTPPDITDYCTPTVGTCGSITRARVVRIYHPAPDWNNGNYTDGGSPPSMAQFTHDNCIGPNNDVHQYQVQNGVNPPFNFTAGNDNNNFIINFCTDGPAAGELAFLIQMSPGNVIHSFDFFADLNQDGDFDDPGEALASMSNLLPTAPGPFFVFTNTLSNASWTGPTHPTVQVPNTAAEGITKLRIVTHRANTAHNDPCYGGNQFTYFYDFDMEIQCTGVLPLYPSDLNWCNVDDVTNFSARVSCFDKNGAPSDTKFHYKVVPHN